MISYSYLSRCFSYIWEQIKHKTYFMNKTILALILCLTISLSSKGQDIKTVFTAMPSKIVYGITPKMKEFLLDEPSDTTRFVSTAIHPNIKRIAIDSDYIALQTSEAGSTQIKLLPLINGSKIVCLVQSVSGTISDSRISFYTETWEAIPRANLFPEKNIEWFIKEDADKTSEEYTQAINSLTMLPMQFILSADENKVDIKFDAKSFLPKEFYKILEPYLTQEAKTLIWDKTRFK